MLGGICLKIFFISGQIFLIEIIFFISMLHGLITFCKVGGIFLILACQHFHSRIYSTLPFMTICGIYQGFLFF